MKKTINITASPKHYPPFPKGEYREICLILLLLISPITIFAQHTIPQSVAGNGHTRISDANSSIQGTVGQSAIGELITPSMTHQVGFWYLADMPVTVIIPDTLVAYADTVRIPVRIQSNTNGLGIVAADIFIAYNNTQVIPSLIHTDLTGTLAATNWSLDDTVLPGVGGMDTLAIAMSTAQDTLTGQGDLVFLNLITSDIRQPTAVPLELTRVTFNDDVPAKNRQDGSLSLSGFDGTVTAASDTVGPAENITITVTDVDANTNSGITDSLQILAFGKTHQDSQSVWIFETTDSSGVFAGDVVTTYNAAGGTSQDGIIHVIDGDSVYVEYTDVLAASGNTENRQTIVEIFGGADGQLRITYVVQAATGRNSMRDSVKVEVIDPDRNIDSGVIDQVTVAINNLTGSDLDTLQLNETGNSTGIFRLRVPTLQGTSGTNNDGILTLAAWDTLQATYTDLISIQPGPTDLTDTVRVTTRFGDVTLNDSLHAIDASTIMSASVGLITPTPQMILVGDVDGSGDLTAFDATLVRQYAVQVIDRFPVQTDTVLLPPSDLKNHPFLKPASTEGLIAFGEPQYRRNGIQVVPIILGERAGILSGDLKLTLDPGIEITEIKPDQTYQDFEAIHHTKELETRVAFSGAQTNLKDNGNVIWLSIKLDGDGPFLLDLSHLALNGYDVTPTLALTPIELIPASLPTEFALYHNLPNPFNPQTTIRYDLPEATLLSIHIYNVLGQQIKTLVSEVQEAGAYEIIWNGKDALERQVSSGVYFTHMQAGDFRETQKMLLLK